MLLCLFGLAENAVNERPLKRLSRPGVAKPLGESMKDCPVCRTFQVEDPARHFCLVKLTAIPMRRSTRPFTSASQVGSRPRPAKPSFVRRRPSARQTTCTHRWQNCRDSHLPKHPDHQVLVLRRTPIARNPGSRARSRQAFPADPEPSPHKGDPAQHCRDSPDPWARCQQSRSADRSSRTLQSSI